MKIPGMTNMEEVDPADEARTYRQQPFHNRIIVASAGSFMHFVMAFALAWVASWPSGSPPTNVVDRGLHAWAGQAANAAQQAGLHEGRRDRLGRRPPLTGPDQLETAIPARSAGRSSSGSAGPERLRITVTPVDGRTIRSDGRRPRPPRTGPRLHRGRPHVGRRPARGRSGPSGRRPATWAASPPPRSPGSGTSSRRTASDSLFTRSPTPWRPSRRPATRPPPPVRCRSSAPSGWRRRRPDRRALPHRHPDRPQHRDRHRQHAAHAAPRRRPRGHRRLRADPRPARASPTTRPTRPSCCRWSTPSCWCSCLVVVVGRLPRHRPPGGQPVRTRGPAHGRLGGWNSNLDLLLGPAR